MKSDSHTIPQNYGINRWGDGYFGINEQGNVAVMPDRNRPVAVDLHQLAHEVKDQGLSWPVLVRFVDILHSRVESLCRGFSKAFKEYEYQSKYTAVYPIKVNQQRSVVEEIVTKGGDCVGLEAGSKPELMVVLAHSPEGGVIVCNGYKDREYIRLALLGQRLGNRVFIVIEKPSELEIVLDEAEEMGIEPLLGVRVRLSASATGNWQNSGGEKAKFGLTAGQLLGLVDQLSARDKLDSLQLLHSHIGSQIPNLRDIRRCMGEAAQFYSELRRLGANICVVDVGGGLGVDYEGTSSRHYCSINYSMEDYAAEVVWALKRICKEQELPYPEIFSESGRSLTAHHAMLIVNVIDSEPAPQGSELSDMDEDVPEILRTMQKELERIGEGSASEVFQEAEHGLAEARDLFQQGIITLEQRAMAEGLFYAICRRLRPLLRPESSRHRGLIDRINERLADRLFCNFSLFQSLPDVWAIDQIFPVMPLQRLNEKPTRRAVVHDLTCDSDGCIENYVDQDGVEHSIPVHELKDNEPYLMGIFMVGAYQEILGDMHNLFGDTDAVNLQLDENGGYSLTQHESGDSVDELIRYVHYSPEAMLESYRKKLLKSGFDRNETRKYFLELEAGLHGYTYFED
ncbi:MAG: biosynthetic arginine decarboxylase [Chromatiales bacterium]|nr:biosynthetic arginine decarboxylase [Chromatiales bacterium]